MQEYLVFEVPLNIRKIIASSPHTAKNKFQKASRLSDNTDVIVVPTTHARKGKAKIGDKLEAIRARGTP